MPVILRQLAFKQRVWGVKEEEVFGRVIEGLPNTVNSNGLCFLCKKITFRISARPNFVLSLDKNHKFSKCLCFVAEAREK